MAMLNESHAYDLSLFEPHQAKIVRMKPNKKLEKAKKTRNAVQSVINSIVSVLAFAGVISVMCVMISSHIQLTELQGAIRASKIELAGLESENVRLTDDLARKTSARNVEEYVRETLGMRKAEPSQIAYIQVDEGNKAVIAEKDDSNLLKNIGGAIKNFFNQLAYLFE